MVADVDVHVDVFEFLFCSLFCPQTAVHVHVHVHENMDKRSTKFHFQDHFIFFEMRDLLNKIRRSEIIGIALPSDMGWIDEALSC